MERTDKGRSLKPRIWIPYLALIGIALTIIGFAYYHEEESKIQREKYDGIASVAKLKINQIENWRSERIENALVFSRSSFTSDAIPHLIKSPADLRLRRAIQKQLTLECSFGLYSDAFILDTTERVFVSIRDSSSIDTSEKERFHETVLAHKPVMTDLFRGTDGRVHIDVMAPIIDGSGETAVVVVLRSDADNFIYPLINSWPVPSQSAETLLLERRGDQIVFLNSLRYLPSAALSLRLPITMTTLPAEQAAMGRIGMFEGKDYRGVDVLADLRSVPNTPWFMVAKVDKSEILAEAKYRRDVVIIFAILFMVVSITFTAYSYRRSQADVYRAMYRAELERKEAQEEFKTTLYSIGDAVITTDIDGRIKQMNRVAERLTGWTEHDASGKALEEVFRIVDEETHSSVENPVKRALREGLVVGLANHTLLISRDGTEYPVADSGAPIRDETGTITGIVLIFRDQTKEREAENKLSVSETRYRRLFESAKDGILILDAETGMIVDVNPFLIEMFGFSLEQFIGKKIWQLEVLRDVFSSREKFSELQQKGYVRYEDLPLQTADGRRIDVEFVSNVYFVDNKKVIQCNIRDISGRKRAEIAVRESQQMLRTVMDSVPVRVFWKDMNGVFLGCNLPFARDSGFDSPDEIVGKDDFQMGWRDQAELYRADDRQVIESGIPKLGYEEPQSFSEGTRWLRTSKIPLRNAGGDIIGVLGTYEDVTETKEAESQLAYERYLLNALLEKTVDPIYFKDTEGRFTRVSMVMATKRKLTSVDQLLGKTDFDFFSREHAQKIFEQEQEIIRTGEPIVDVEIQEYWKDRPPTWASVTKVPLHDAAGKIVGLFGISRDITERKKAEVALRESEERFRGLVEGSAAAIMIHDGNTFLYTNPAGLEMTGYTAEELSRMSPMEIVHPDFREFVANRLAERVDGKDVPKHYEYQILKKSGEAVWIDFSGAVIDYNGKPAIIASSYDISDRKRLEEQLLQAQKMDSIGRLAGGIAHDYNNMLGIIIGYGDLLMNKMDNVEPAHRYVESIMSAAKHAADITRQLLAFARREMVSPSVLNPNKAIDLLRVMLQRLIGENIMLTFVPANDLWNIKIDQTQFDQILVNLATNARDAIEDIGVMTIETSNVSIDEDYARDHIDFSPGEYVVISFTDTGNGMSKETMEKIFEPFFTTKPKGQGTGLGLSTVYGIVKQNGGSVSVRSEIGTGTTFKIYLPRYRSKAEEPEPAPVEQAIRGNETVLIVEDQAELLELSKDSLEGYGYKVLTASSPEEGILQCEGYHDEIHVLLTDVIMPVMNGKELRDKIRAMKPNIKTIFMSGYTADIIAHQGVLDQGVDFIQKPFKPHELAKKVHEVLKG